MGARRAARDRGVGRTGALQGRDEPRQGARAHERRDRADPDRFAARLRRARPRARQRRRCGPRTGHSGAWSRAVRTCAGRGGPRTPARSQKEQGRAGRSARAGQDPRPHARDDPAAAARQTAPRQARDRRRRARGNAGERRCRSGAAPRPQGPARAAGRRARGMPAAARPRDGPRRAAALARQAAADREGGVARRPVLRAEHGAARRRGAGTPARRCDQDGRAQAPVSRRADGADVRARPRGPLRAAEAPVAQGKERYARSRRRAAAARDRAHAASRRDRAAARGRGARTGSSRSMRPARCCPRWRDRWTAACIRVHATYSTSSRACAGPDGG